MPSRRTATAEGSGQIGRRSHRLAALIPAGGPTAPPVNGQVLGSPLLCRCPRYH
jgi:hypothetical protein